MPYLDRAFENENEVVTIPSTNVIKFSPESLKVDNASVVVTKEVYFTEIGAGTYTGTIVLPAGSRIIDIGVDGQALWSATTSAEMDCWRC